MANALIDIDVRAVVPSISVPTIVIHATDDIVAPVDNGRWLAAHIPEAQFVEMDGGHGDYDHDRLADEIELFLIGTHKVIASNRVLATVLFSDIVGSTKQAASIGDQRWSRVLDQHDSVIRQTVDTYRGTLVKSTGDGVLATFDGPARAVLCGCEIRERLRPFGLEIRVGVHTGEIELRGDEISGIAVHIGARVAAVANGGEVLVSRTVTDLVAGSGIEFVDRGEHQLKGVPGTWRLYAATS